MATPIKFHLDQHVATAVAHGLRQYGVDVTTTCEAGLQNADDPPHLEYALAAGRVLVTHDRGFIERHNCGEGHAGIAYAPQQKYRRRPGDVVRALHLIYVCLSAEEMEGHLEFF